MKNPKLNTYCFSVRCILGCVLILSGILKSVNIVSFAQEVQQYTDLYMLGFLRGWSHGIAIVVCSLELLIGILALSGLYKMLVSVAFVMLSSFFLYLTGVNVFFPSEYFGSIESCGCFGELIHFSPMASFVKSAVLWIMAILLLLVNMRKDSAPIVLKELIAMLRDARTYMLMVLSFIPSWFSVCFLDSMDHRIYIALYMLLCLFMIICEVILYCGKIKNRHISFKAPNELCVVNNNNNK